ncbi:MAG: type I-U CRISPR-associated protein Cas5/Cas6, partial [Planctomycetes bacterium]|nr:type I-U CRISPR-associated protein Cas5/Cas6 [Planctomycetota bacterium]
WEPAAPGVVTARMLRTPAPDALVELTRCHESFMRRLEGGVYKPPERPGERAFKLTGYFPRTQLPARPVAAFGLRATDGSDAWFRGNPTLTNHIAAMVRHVACESAKSESDRFPGGSNAYVRGKVDQSIDNPARFSYQPVPTIGHIHADGLIRRVLIAEHAGGDGTHVSWAAQRLRGVSLLDEKTGEPIAILDAMPSRDSVTAHYLGPSSSWSSVTPVILPGFDDGKLKKRDALVLKAIRQAGIPVEAVESFTLRKAPFWPGSQHPREYRRPSYLRHYPAWHMYIRFRQPVSGPLMIGAGRHGGLGVLATEC